MNKIKVSAVLTCSQDSKISELANLLKNKNSRRVFVVDKSKKLLGVITTTDLVYRGLTSKNSDLIAKQIMTKNVKSVDIKENLEKALEIMNSFKTYVCPITNNKKLLGIVHHHDILSYLVSSEKKK